MRRLTPSPPNHRPYALLPARGIHRVVLVEQLRSDVLAERAIALPLRFVEELIRGRLLREGLMMPRILEDIHRLVAGQRRLDVDQRAAALAGVDDARERR